MEKLISVIIPVYNVSRYLKQCVDSVLNQSYRNLEIILVDDGSTDDSGLLCDKYALSDSRIVVIHKENGGLSDARNVGIAAARGDYIGFVDSDDFIHTEMYRVLADAIEDNEADIAMANWQFFLDGRENDLRDDRTGSILAFEGMETLEFLIYGAGGYRVSLSVWDRLYRREIVENLFFPKGKCYEDVVWSVKIFYRARKGVYVDKSLYYYRRRDDSIVGVDNKNGLSRRVVTDEIPQIGEQIQFLRDVGQEKMADEVTYFLYEKILRYYTICYYDNSELEEELFEIVNSYMPWARSYMHRCGSVRRKCILFASLHALKMLIFLVYTKNRGKNDYS